MSRAFARLFSFKAMADFDKLRKVIHGIASSFEESAVGCLDAHHIEIGGLVREQLYSGLDGDENSLRPTYTDDPFFDLPTRWQGDPDGYIEWKEKITPPETSRVLHLHARHRDTPNLIITGRFYESIFVSAHNGSVFIDTVGFVDGPDIVRKYGENILGLGATARSYVVQSILTPWLERFFREKGYV